MNFLTVISYTKRQYRFGFNGMMKDNEVKGIGNSLDFGARMYDSRVARWFTRDPFAAKYPDLSPYHFSGNSPLLFKDVDGRKFVNPYKQDYEDAQLKLANAESIYNEVLRDFPEASKSELKYLREKTGVTSAQKELENIRPKYQEVQDYLYTLKVSSPSEYDYFDNLKDHKTGSDINISIWLGGENPSGTDVGLTLGLYKYQDYTPTADPKEGIRIRLYEKGAGRANTFQSESGRNYRTFANELGDIKYFFENVKDEASYNFHQSTANSASSGYSDPKGAGQASSQYEKNRVKDVKEYSRNGMQSSESYNSMQQTIEKR